MKAIIFDLDGTLTDSGEGIINCASLALRTLGLPVPDRDTMRVFVGPPLRETFQKFGVPPEDVERAIEIYRSRYIPVGLFENTPYPGIPALLAALRAEGHRLYVATAKPESMAITVLEEFGLSRYFHQICGATLDGAISHKDQVIACLLEHMEPADDTVMIGDTTFDVIGAAAYGIPTIGVSWGYGKTSDMLDAGATAIAHSPAHLLELLSK